MPMFSDTRKATPKAKRGYAVMPRLDPLMIHIDPYMIHLDHRMIIFFCLSCESLNSEKGRWIVSENIVTI